MRKFTLRKRDVINSKKRIREILDDGMRFHGELVSLYFLPSETMAFAVLINRKVGKPYRRNRVKRWIREIYRDTISELPESVDILILAQKPYDSLSFETLKSDINRLLERVKNKI
ncbi:ribonuclease P protein component [candidate division KSB1 bacterium]